MLNGLDLFSGIGGIALALAPWVRPVAYCEIDPHAQGVLFSRMADGEIPIAPVWDDIRSLNGTMVGEIDIVCGGFPCQDISVAGAGAGLAGERSGLFWEIIRLCGELAPHFVFLENVPAITTRGGIDVVGAFASLGYDCRFLIIPSGHGLDGFRGNRWFCLAKAEGQRLEASGERSGNKTEIPLPASQVQVIGLDLRRPTVEPTICGIPYGLPNRVDRIRGLGNAVVPLQARRAFEVLMGL